MPDVCRENRTETLRPPAFLALRPEGPDSPVPSLSPALRPCRKQRSSTFPLGGGAGSGAQGGSAASPLDDRRTRQHVCERRARLERPVSLVTCLSGPPEELPASERAAGRAASAWLQAPPAGPRTHLSVSPRGCVRRRRRPADPQRRHQQLQPGGLLPAAPPVLLQLLPQVRVSMLDVAELQKSAAEAPLQLRHQAV